MNTQAIPTPDLLALRSLYLGVTKVTLMRCALEVMHAFHLLTLIDRELGARSVTP